MSDLSVTMDFSRYHDTCEHTDMYLRVTRNEGELMSTPDFRDSLTVEYGRRPGAAFFHKMMQYVVCHDMPYN